MGGVRTMANNKATAKRWMQWLLTREEIPFRSALAAYFANPAFARLCDCGCNSFDLALPDQSELPLLRQPSELGGMFFELNYRLPENHQLEVLFFVDKAGRLSGIDIEVDGNSFPVPDEPIIGELLNVSGSATVAS